MLDIPVTDIAAFQKKKKKKKEGRFPKSHRKTEVSGKTDTHLGYLYTLRFGFKISGYNLEDGKLYICY